MHEHNEGLLYNNCIVSIIVVVYNSEKTVCETLDSIYSQTWPQIELLISDDCSTDNTVDVVDNWINSYGDRFTRVVLVKGEENKGIPANINKALRRATGSYIQLIAGDDMFVSDGIERRMKYVLKFPDDVIHTRSRYLGEDDTVVINLEHKYNATIDVMLGKSVKKQYRRLLYEQFIMPLSIGPIHRNVYRRIGLFDERYRLDEDWLMFLKLYSCGYRIRAFPDVTSIYRLSDTSVSHNRNRQYFDCQRQLYMEIRKPIMISNCMYRKCLIQDIQFLMCDIIDKYGKSSILYALCNVVLCILSPKVFVGKIWNRINR